MDRREAGQRQHHRAVPPAARPPVERVGHRRRAGAGSTLRLRWADGLWRRGRQGDRHHRPARSGAAEASLLVADRESGSASRHGRHGREALQVERPLLRRPVAAVPSGRTGYRSGRRRSRCDRFARSEPGDGSRAHSLAGHAGRVPQHLRLQAQQRPRAPDRDRGRAVRARLRSGPRRRRLHGRRARREDPGARHVPPSGAATTTSTPATIRTAPKIDSTVAARAATTSTTSRIWKSPSCSSR